MPNLAPLLEMEDPIGVISLYADADPERMTGPRAQWEIEAGNGIRALRESVKETLAHERWTAVHQRLDALEPEIAALLDRQTEGRGRALFASVSSGRVETVRLQVALPDLLVFDRRPHVWPLVAAIEQHPPTGVVNVSRDGIRAVDWRIGLADEVLWLTFDEDAGEWKQKIGTSGNNPALAAAAGGGGADGGGPSTGAMYQQSGAAQRDRFARKLEDHQIRFIAHASQDVARLAQAQGWERVVVAGDPRLTEPLEAELPPAIEPLIVRGTFQWQRPHELVEAVAPEVERAAGERMARLVSEARERAGAGGHGALGLAEVLDALVQGRVDTLIVDPSCAPAGVRAPDGRLAPAGQGLPGASADELEPEPHLVERMVELALETSGRVVPVQAEAAAELADVDGVAAILRW